MKKQYNILILLLLIPFLGFSNDDAYISKQKNIKKTYIVNSNAGIDIDNKYGNISVSTWDEDKIDLDIIIKVTGPSENWVNEKLNSIDVNITALKSLVSAVTTIGNSSLKSKGSNNFFEINYVIKIPKNGSAKLLNKYGDITTENIYGPADIACKYGKISLGKLNNSSNNVKIEYCQNSAIDYIKNGNIIARYSGLKINESGNLNLDTNYTDLVILEGQNIKYNCNYGTFKFQKINSFTGSGNYLTISIAEISNSVNLDTKYSKINISNVTSKANNVNINSGYSDVYMGYDMNYSFDFDINTRYGGIKSDNSLDVLINETKNTSKRISGFNKKKGQNKVTINSNYGNVTLNKKQ
ncbi:hypothetical protein B0A75_17640 [Flavobacterium oncorhynchi]|uniref:Adhesin domain-containing protein n=1 Tax=Flavobacterium oncorhynchi TaxID=728056 RepID=A0A226HUA9_9FLAO|nr:MULTISPECIES: hypothetical protein [Flavobacterium]OXA97236.1 hypothetical protein B0A75_17640 [Flavobacterium oncorhynchi]RXM42028.1 hypothetical protein BOW57_18220 [Flavobacterium sp. YO64]